jgi:hypothetical protein
MGLTLRRAIYYRGVKKKKKDQIDGGADIVCVAMVVAAIQNATDISVVNASIDETNQ